MASQKMHAPFGEGAASASAGQRSGDGQGGQGLSSGVVLLMALAAGLAVANVYYSQPLIDAIAGDVGLSRSLAGLIGTLTQAGYGFGLLLIAPLGDLMARRPLIMGHLLLSSAALGVVAIADDGRVLLGALLTVGLLAVVAQVIVAHASSLAPHGRRGQVVGTVTSGIIMGILLARTLAGTVTDLFGWRAVYIVAALATLAVVGLLALFLPSQPRREPPLAYRRLIVTMLMLFVEEPVVRARAILALVIFFAITVLLTPLSLALSAPPYSLSYTAIGLFGLAGAAGALGAISSGRLADRGHAETMTGTALLLMLAAWGAAALLPLSIWSLVLAVFVMDFGLQAVHVASQSLIYRVRADAQSRLAASYMIFYSIGSAAGALSSTLAFAWGGWLAVCLLGGSVTVAGLVFWLATRTTRRAVGADAIS